VGARGVFTLKVIYLRKVPLKIMAVGGGGRRKHFKYRNEKLSEELTNFRLSYLESTVEQNCTLGRGQLKCDGTCAKTRFRLSAKRTSPFKSAGGVRLVE